MKRFWYLACYLVLLMVASSSADAGSSFSFVIGGHHIHIETPRHCGSPSCVSVSISGTHRSRWYDDDRDRYDDKIEKSDTAAAPPAPAVQPVAPAAAVTPARPAVAPVASAPPAITQSAPVAQVTAVPVRVTASVAVSAPSNPPPVMPQAAIPATDAPPAPKAPPVISRVSHEIEEDPSSPIGDWQTEGKTGSVRIQACGRALCGYVLDASSDTVGESVLINMKSKTATEWSGNVYSRSSGETYYGTIAMNGANALRVEACALGQFFCSSNLWSRIDVKPQRMITSRQVVPAPRS
jgi:hypothetical protein